MDFKEEDLERILELTLTEVSQAGIDVEAVEASYRKAVASVVEEKANAVETLYGSLDTGNFYVESFQMATKKRGAILESGWQMIAWEDVRSRVNSLFGKGLDTNNRGDGQVYVWLEPRGEKFVLCSYGNAHKDGYGRRNMHYFALAEDENKLREVLDSFSFDMNNIRTFCSQVFEWKNEPVTRMSGEPDLFSNFTELYVCVDGTVKKYQV